MLLLVLEVVGGLLSHSLALLSDAGHMLTDALAVFLSYFAVVWSKKPPTPQRTFGYHRLEILISLVNGLTLIAVSIVIIYEAIHRFFYPEQVKAGLLLAVATVGLIGNIAGVFLLRRESELSLNVRGTFLHLLGDALSSVGVIIGGLIIAFTGWTVVDAIISILIGGIVLRSAGDLVLQSGEILLEYTPRDINVDELRKNVEQIEGVKEIHDIHIWTITSGRRALSAHIMTDNITTKESQNILCSVRGLLADEFQITHTTLEVECDTCQSNICEFSIQKPITRHIHKHSHEDGDK